MDKETLSNYGWIVICVMVLAVMIALATPFGSFVSEAVQSTTKGLFDVNKNALNSTGMIVVSGNRFDSESGDFYKKPSNAFAIMNYYEWMSACDHFDDEGGLASHCIAIYENAGHNINDFQRWDENLEFMNEYLHSELTEHMHIDTLVFEYEYKENMTWYDFVNSSANAGRFAIDTDGSIYYAISGVNYGHKVLCNNTTEIKDIDKIDKDEFYFIGFANIN